MRNVRSKSFQIAVISGIAFAITAAIVASQITSTDQNLPDKAPIERPPSVKIGDYGTSTTLDNARQTVNYKISMPSDLPQQARLSTVKIDSMWKEVYLIFAPPNVQISDATTLPELTEKAGMVIWYAPLGENVNVQEILTDYETHGAGKAFTIHGLPAVGSEKQSDVDIPTILHIFREDRVRITIMSDLPLQTLIGIAERMDLTV
jgi:hypothetical protein